MVVTVTSVEEFDFAGFVYDISTENGTFTTVSKVCLKNTDSVYVKWRTGADVNMRNVFKKSEEAAAWVSSHYKSPVFLEFENMGFSFSNQISFCIKKLLGSITPLKCYFWTLLCQGYDANGAILEEKVLFTKKKLSSLWRG